MILHGVAFGLWLCNPVPVLVAVVCRPGASCAYFELLLVGFCAPLCRLSFVPSCWDFSVFYASVARYLLSRSTILNAHPTPRFAYALRSTRRTPSPPYLFFLTRHSPIALSCIVWLCPSCSCMLNRFVPSSLVTLYRTLGPLCRIISLQSIDTSLL